MIEEISMREALSGVAICALVLALVLTAGLLLDRLGCLDRGENVRRRSRRRARRERLDVSRLRTALLFFLLGLGSVVEMPVCARDGLDVPQALTKPAGRSARAPLLAAGLWDRDVAGAPISEAGGPVSGEFFFGCVLGFAVGLWLFGCWATRRLDRRLWEISVRLSGGLDQPSPTTANHGQQPSTLIQGVDPL